MYATKRVRIPQLLCKYANAELISRRKIITLVVGLNAKGESKDASSIPSRAIFKTLSGRVTNKPDLYAFSAAERKGDEFARKELTS